MEFLLRMQVPAGQPLAGMVHHKIHDENWTGLPLLPEQDTPAAALPARRSAPRRRSTWPRSRRRRRGCGRRSTRRSRRRRLTAAQTAYAAAKANPAGSRPTSDGTGGGAYGDTTSTDEFYWAAAELYVTTGKSGTYRADVTGSSLYKGGSFAQRGYDWGWTGGLGDIDARAGPERASVVRRGRHPRGHRDVRRRALARATSQAYPAPNNAGERLLLGLERPGRQQRDRPGAGVRLHRAGEVPHRRLRRAATTSSAATRSTSPTSPVTARRRSRTCTTGSGPTRRTRPCPIAPPGRRSPAAPTATCRTRSPRRSSRAARRRSATWTTSRRTRSTRSRSTGTPRWPGWRAGRRSTRAGHRRSTPRGRARRARRRRARSATPP